MSWLCRADGSQLLSGVLHTKQAHVLIPEFIKPTLGIQTQPQVVSWPGICTEAKASAKAKTKAQAEKAKAEAKAKGEALGRPPDSGTMTLSCRYPWTS